MRQLCDELEDNIDLARALEAFRPYDTCHPLDTTPNGGVKHSTSEHEKDTETDDDPSANPASYFSRYCTILGQIVKAYLEMCYNSFVEAEFPPELRM